MNRATRLGSCMPDRMKLVVVGDGQVGKSSLLTTFATGTFPEPYVPTVCNLAMDYQHDGSTVCLVLFDIPGQEDYARLRPLSYLMTDVFLVCFAIDNLSSYQYVFEKLLPEIRYHCPDVPAVLVGCKSDLRASFSGDCVTSAQAIIDAERNGMKYIETSALKNYQVQHCFQVAISIAFEALVSRKAKSRKLLRRSEPVPPIVPPAGKAPVVEVQTSVFGDQWRAAAENPNFSDVCFITSTEQRFKAHRIVLSSTSEIFNDLFLHKHNQLAVGKGNITREQICSGHTPGFSKIYDEEITQDGVASVQTAIELSADVSASAFANVLQFLYSGLPYINLESSEREINEVLNLAETFRLPHLKTICENILQDEEILNPSIGTFLNGKMGEQFKQLFFNQDVFSDMVFIVEGTKVFVHKAVLAARCDVMQAMFSANFLEGFTSEVNLPDVALEPFLAVLEYIYTDRLPTEPGDPVAILAVAHQYLLERLITLCEHHLMKEVDQAVVNNITDSEIDVIGLLHMSQLYQANQLAQWCRHVIASNYESFVEREEFSTLTGDNLTYVEENRWPPLSYLEEAKKYEKKMKKHGPKSCLLM